MIPVMRAIFSSDMVESGGVVGQDNFSDRGGENCERWNEIGAEMIGTRYGITSYQGT